MNSLSQNGRPRLSPRARMQIDRVTGKPIVLYPEGVLVLNATGQAILGLCDGTATLQQIIARLTQSYAISAEEVSAQVTAYLERLRALNLLDMVESE